jgi:hypothetical protein
MEKVAILYICTGKYEVFWKNFYESANQYLLPGYEKHYFVFTDAASIFDEGSPRVHKIFQESLPWPYPTLYRFKFFKSIQDQLLAFDYIYFFNSNIRVVKEIVAKDFLPLDNEELVVTNHPYYWNKKNTKFTYERNPASKAFVPAGQGKIYAAGGLNGGRAKDYLEFVDACYNFTREDESNGIIAVWHDESYLNRYIIDRKVKVLHPGFLYPAETAIPFEKMIHLERKGDFLQGYGKYSQTGTGKREPWYKKINAMFKSKK